MDVPEQEAAYLIHPEMPGVKHGERTLRAERYSGRVSRAFQLAQDIDEGKASAKFTDGALEPTLPKRTTSPTRRLTID